MGIPIIQEQPRRQTTGQMFGQAFGNIGASLGQNIGQALTGRAEKQKLVQADKEMVSFADRLEADNPGSPTHKFVADVYRSKLPAEQKSELIKNVVGIDPYRAEQQKRLQQDIYVRTYNAKIKEIDNELKEARTIAPKGGGKSEREILIARKRQLQAERDALLDFVQIEEEEEDEELSTTKNKKIKFDPANKEHIAKREQLLKKFKGDKNKVNAELAKEFER